MRILFDHQAFSRQDHGGVSRYFFELARNLKGLPGAEPELSVPYSNNHYLRTSALWAPRPFGFGRKLPGQRTLLELVNRFSARRRLAAGGFDIFHPTYYSPYFLDLLGGRPYVLTVFDMIHEKFPEYYRTDSTCAQKRAVIGGAARIIAISESTKRDLVEILGVPAGKIEVVYLGNSLDTSSTAGVAGPALPSRYLLFVGERAIYKNFPNFAAAVAPLLKEDSSLYLLCAGGRPFSAEEAGMFEGLGCPDKFLHVPVADASLPAVYKGALLLAVPSLYEGFGIPVLEAMSLGCPVIASGRSSLPEVGGPAAGYFDPSDGEAMLAAARRVAGDKDLRAKMAADGLAQAAKFSWKLAAEKTYAIYSAVSAGRNWNTTESSPADLGT